MRGRDIRESDLGTVPRAATVGGFTIQKFFATPAPNTPTTEIFRGKEFVLKASCGSDRRPTLLMDGVRGVRPPNVAVFGTSFANPVSAEAKHDDELNPGDDLELATSSTPNMGGTAIVSTRKGRVTTIHFGTDGGTTRRFGRIVCAISGTVIAG